jgi:ABC-type microcin C transport system permease subunit YejB
MCNLFFFFSYLKSYFTSFGIDKILSTNINSVGYYDKVPAVYLFKTSLPLVALLIITKSSLAIRPLYPILLAFIFECIWIFFYTLISNDPRTMYTESFVEILFT